MAKHSTAPVSDRATLESNGEAFAVLQRPGIEQLAARTGIAANQPREGQDGSDAGGEGLTAPRSSKELSQAEGDQ